MRGQLKIIAIIVGGVIGLLFVLPWVIAVAAMYMEWVCSVTK